MIGYSRRYTAVPLVDLGVVSTAVPAGQVYEATYELAHSLRAKGKNALYRQTLTRIKSTMYADAIKRLTSDFVSMGWTNKPKGIDRPVPIPQTDKNPRSRL